MAKKPDFFISPENFKLFDYSPGEPPEDEMFDLMARSGDKPESVKDPKERAIDPA